MTTKKPPKAPGLTPLETVRSTKMVFPNGMALAMNNVRGYLVQLSIEPVLEKVGGEGQKVLHVTDEQAVKLGELFKAKHWRKFKAAEKK